MISTEPAGTSCSCLLSRRDRKEVKGKHTQAKQHSWEMLPPLWLPRLLSGPRRRCSFPAGWDSAPAHHFTLKKTIWAVWFETMCERHSWWTEAISHHPTTVLLLVLILQHSSAPPSLTAPLPFPKYQTTALTEHSARFQLSCNLQEQAQATEPLTPFSGQLFQMSALSALTPPLCSDSFWVIDSSASAVQLIPQESPSSSKSQNQQADSCACQACCDSVNVCGTGAAQPLLSAVKIRPLWARDRKLNVCTKSAVCYSAAMPKNSEVFHWSAQIWSHCVGTVVNMTIYSVSLWE